MLEFDEAFLNIISDNVDSKLVTLLKEKANELAKTDYKTAILLRYAAGSIDIRCTAIQFLRLKIKGE